VGWKRIAAEEVEGFDVPANEARHRRCCRARWLMGDRSSSVMAITEPDRALSPE
jgi:hypothetical protein